jgi:hypothetical protein
MILGTYKNWVLGIALGVLAAPALAATPAAPAAGPLASADGQRPEAGHSRRVELPFQLDFRAPEAKPATAAPRPKAEPHPFRESGPKHAALDLSGRAASGLSHPPQFG